MALFTDFFPEGGGGNVDNTVPVQLGAALAGFNIMAPGAAIGGSVITLTHTTAQTSLVAMDDIRIITTAREFLGTITAVNAGSTEFTVMLARPATAAIPATTDNSVMVREIEDGGETTLDGDLVVGGDIYGDTFHGDVVGDVTGNSDTATALQNTRQFSITGDVTAPAQPFNGTQDVILTADIPANTITANEIAENAITSSELGPLSVGTGNIIDDAVTAAKLNPDTAGNGLTQGASGALDVTLGTNSGLIVGADSLAVNPSIAGTGLTFTNGVLNVQALNINNTHQYTGTRTTDADVLADLVAAFNTAGTAVNGINVAVGTEFNAGDLVLLTSHNGGTGANTESYIYVGDNRTASASSSDNTIATTDFVDITHSGDVVESAVGSNSIMVSSATGNVTFNAIVDPMGGLAIGMAGIGLNSTVAGSGLTLTNGVLSVQAGAGVSGTPGTLPVFNAAGDGLDDSLVTQTTGTPSQTFTATSGTIAFRDVLSGFADVTSADLRSATEAQFPPGPGTPLVTGVLTFTFNSVDYTFPTANFGRDTNSANPGIFSEQIPMVMPSGLTGTSTGGPVTNLRFVVAGTGTNAVNIGADTFVTGSNNLTVGGLAGTGTRNVEVNAAGQLVVGTDDVGVMGTAGTIPVFDSSDDGVGDSVITQTASNAISFTGYGLQTSATGELQIRDLTGHTVDAANVGRTITLATATGATNTLDSATGNSYIILSASAGNFYTLTAAGAFANNVATIFFATGTGTINPSVTGVNVASDTTIAGSTIISGATSSLQVGNLAGTGTRNVAVTSNGTLIPQTVASGPADYNLVIASLDSASPTTVAAGDLVVLPPIPETTPGGGGGTNVSMLPTITSSSITSITNDAGIGITATAVFPFNNPEQVVGFGSAGTRPLYQGADVTFAGVTGTAAVVNGTHEPTGGRNGGAFLGQGTTWTLSLTEPDPPLANFGVQNNPGGTISIGGGELPDIPFQVSQLVANPAVASRQGTILASVNRLFPDTIPGITGQQIADMYVGTGTGSTRGMVSFDGTTDVFPLLSFDNSTGAITWDGDYHVPTSGVSTARITIIPPGAGGDTPTPTPTRTNRTFALPSNPTAGTQIQISNLSATATGSGDAVWGFTNHGGRIMNTSVATNTTFELDDATASFILAYTDATYGWVVIGAN